MAGIFISYRREDSPGHAGRIFDRLRSRFGSDVVFMDVAAIEAGVDFVEVLHKAVGSCDALLAVIGPQWLSAAHDGRRRLDDPHDFVRIEIAGALERNVRVLPVLVEGASVPRTDTLPPELQALTRRQAIELRDARWDDDIDRLIEGLEKFLKVGGEVRTATSPPVGTERPSAKTSTGRGMAIGAVAAVILVVIGAVFAWRGGLFSGNRGAVTEPPAQVVAVPPVSPPAATPTTNPGPASNAGNNPGPARGSTNTKPTEPPPAPGPVTSAAMPDVTGKTILEAREILRRAGFRFLIRLSADRAKAPGIVESQRLDESTVAGKPPIVLLNANATSSILVHVAKGDERKAEALVSYLKDQPSTIGSVVRSQEVVPRAEIIGRVGYSEDRLAEQAEAIAKDASAYLARTGSGTLQIAMIPRIARGVIIVGLYERVQ